MSSWGYTAITLAAFFSLLAPCLVAVAEAHEAIALHGDELPAFVGESPMTASRSLSAQDTKLHTSALHQTAQSNATDAASLSGSYTLRGIKPGLSATCYGQPCSASACYPAALVTVKRFVNYVNVTAIVQFSWRYQITTCSDLTSSSCEIFADGGASVRSLTQLTDTSYSVLVQLTQEGVARLQWRPSDCSGAAVQILLTPITYDITPPTLAIVQKSGKGNVTLAQTMPTSASGGQTSSRRLHYFTVSPDSSSISKAYGANVVFSFSEAVQGFGGNYAFIHGGRLSSAGLNETLTQQEFSGTIVADNTKSALVMVTGSTYKDLAGNAGTSDLNATVPVLLLSMDSVLGSTSSSTHLSSASMAGVIVGVILGACFTALLCFLCAWRRSQFREAEEQQAAAAAAAAAGPAGSEGVKAGKVGAQGGVMMDRAPEEGLGVKPSAPTSVPLRVRFGEATARTASAQGNTASRAGSASELAPTRSELPISTLTDARMMSEDEPTLRGGRADGTITRTDREGSVDDRSDSAMLDSRPSGPLIQDPSGVYPYGSGSYEGSIASFPSDAAGQAQAVQNAAAPSTPRLHSRLAHVSEGPAVPSAATAAGSRAWGDVDLTADG